MMIRPTGTAHPGFAAAVLVAIAFFIAIAPTLSWLEFSGGSENLVIAAALEMKRGGPILVPNLQGETRIAKPPIATWSSAAGIRSETFSQLSSPDPAIRDPAFHRVAFEMRWPALAAACLLLIATYALGRTLFDGTVGLIGACACGSTILFLRFSRLATTDIHLSLWVTVANTFLALIILRGKTWTGCIGTGIALGLAVMSKGPVAMLQTIAPCLAFVIFRRMISTREVDLGRRRHVFRQALAPLAGLGLMLAIFLPWVIAVIHKDLTARTRWWSEISRENATEMRPDPWYVYFIFIYWIAPTIVWAMSGLVTTVQSVVGRILTPFRTEKSTGFEEARHDDPALNPAKRSRHYERRPLRELIVASDNPLLQRRLLLVLLVFVPIVLMSFAKDKNDRYLLPMVPPAALLAASAFTSWVRAGRRNDAGSVVTRALHWLLLLVFVMMLPILGATYLHKVDGAPWFTVSQALIYILIGLAIWLAGMLYSIRNTYAAVAGTTALMLFLQYPAMLGYRDMGPGRSELKPIADAIWRVAPTADVYEYDIAGRTRVRYDFPIYLNRITRKTSDARVLRATDRPIALIYLEGRPAQEPALTDDWKLAADGATGKNKWRVYVLPASTR